MCEVNKTDFSHPSYCVPVIYFYPFCPANAREDARNSADPYIYIYASSRLLQLFSNAPLFPETSTKVVAGQHHCQGEKEDVKLLNSGHKESTQTHRETTFVLLKKSPFLNVSAVSEESWHFA